MVSFFEVLYPKHIIINLAHDGFLFMFDPENISNNACTSTLDKPSSLDIQLYINSIKHKINDFLLDVSLYFFNTPNMLEVEVKTSIYSQVQGLVEKKHTKQTNELDEFGFKMKYMYHHKTNPLRTYNYRLINYTRSLVSPHLLYIGNSKEWFHYILKEGAWRSVSYDNAAQIHKMFVLEALSQCPEHWKNGLANTQSLLQLNKDHYLIYDDSIMAKPTNSDKFFFLDGFIEIEQSNFKYSLYENSTNNNLNTWCCKGCLNGLIKKNYSKSLWLQFINDISSNSEAKAEYIQLAIGYILLSKKHKIDLQSAFEIVGPPSAGKSVFCDLLFDDIWSDITYRPTADIFSAKGNVTKLCFYGISKSRVTYIQEPTIETEAQAGLIKLLVGSERTVYRELFKDVGIKELDSNLVITTNYPLLGKFQTAGLESRIRSIPFTNVVSKQQIDRNLRKKLAEPCIVNYIIKWCIDGMSHCLKKPDDIINKYIFQQEVNSFILETSDSIVHTFVNLYIRFEPDRDDVKLPASFVKLVFNYYFPDELKVKGFRSELKKYLPSYVKESKYPNKYLSYTHLWIERVYLWDVAASILEKSKRYGIESNDFTYQIKNKSEREFVNYILSVYYDDIESDGEQSLSFYDHKGAYSARVLVSDDLSDHHKDIKSRLKTTAQYKTDKTVQRKK